MILSWHSQGQSTTPNAKGIKTFKVTHTFIPQYGTEYEYVARRLNWGQDRVVYLDKNSNSAKIPTS